MTIQGSFKTQSFKQWELAQLNRHGTGNTTDIGSRIQTLSEVTFYCIVFALIQFWQI